MQTTNLTSTKKFDWLNENSRKFLAAGYLGDSLSAEERIANIAQRAEELLDMPGFAVDAFDNCLSTLRVEQCAVVQYA